MALKNLNWCFWRQMGSVWQPVGLVHERLLRIRDCLPILHLLKVSLPCTTLCVSRVLLLLHNVDSTRLTSLPRSGLSGTSGCRPLQRVSVPRTMTFAGCGPSSNHSCAQQAWSTLKNLSPEKIWMMSPFFFNLLALEDCRVTSDLAWQIKPVPCTPDGQMLFWIYV